MRSLVRHGRQPGPDRLVLLAANLVASVTTLDRSGVLGRSLRGSPIRHVVWLCGVAAVAGGFSTAASMADPRPSGSGTSWPRRGRYEVRSPLFQRVLMLLYCPFRVEARAPRSWSWTLRITLIVASIVAACLCIRWPDAGALEHRPRTRMPKGPASVPRHRFHCRALSFSPGRPGSSLRDARRAPIALRTDGRGPLALGRSRQSEDRRSSAR